MSWSISKFGQAGAVLKSLKKEIADNSYEMSEPEQGIKDAIVLAIKAALRDMPRDTVVQVTACGSQNDLSKGGSINNFSVSVEPKYGTFLTD